MTLAVMEQGERQIILSNQGNGFDLGSNGTERSTSTVVKPGNGFDLGSNSTGTNSGYIFRPINWSPSGTLRDTLLYRQCLCQCVFRMILLPLLLVMFFGLIKFLILVWVVVV